jgi:hypothetical protein
MKIMAIMCCLACLKGQHRPYQEDPINIWHVLIHDGTEDSGEVPKHNVTDNKSHRCLHTDSSDNTFNKTSLISKDKC